MFSGTLRKNLDPFGEYSDQKIWEVLEQSHLKNTVDNLENGLNYNCSEGGDNLR